MTYNGEFDATSIAPKQGGGRHPVGNKFPFTITNTEAKPVKTESGEQPKGGLFEVEFTSPTGSIVFRYNLWNESEQARKIASEQLSALCHATGRFKLDFKNDGKALLGAQGLMDIGFQKGNEPTAEKPEGGYVEIKKVYDMAGNEPGKGPAQAQQQSPQQNYQQGQSNPPANQQPAQGQQPANTGWGQQQQPQQNAANPQNQQNTGWQQNANAPQQQPPWGSS